MWGEIAYINVDLSGCMKVVVLCEKRGGCHCCVAVLPSDTSSCGYPPCSNCSLLSTTSVLSANTPPIVAHHCQRLDNPRDRGRHAPCPCPLTLSARFMPPSQQLQNVSEWLPDV